MPNCAFHHIISTLPLPPSRAHFTSKLRMLLGSGFALVEFIFAFFIELDDFIDLDMFLASLLFLAPLGNVLFLAHFIDFAAFIDLVVGIATKWMTKKNQRAATGQLRRVRLRKRLLESNHQHVPWQRCS